MQARVMPYSARAAPCRPTAAQFGELHYVQPIAAISAALAQLQALPADERAALAGQCPGLPQYLALVPDPRDRRGVRPTLTSLLLAAIAAVLAGARSLTAVGEWVADAPPQVLAALGVRRDPLTGRFEPPDDRRFLRPLNFDIGSNLTDTGIERGVLTSPRA